MNYDLLSLGSAVVDRIVCVSDDFITKNKLKKGGNRNFLDEDHQFLFDQIQPKHILSVPGGSAANTTKVLAGLGLKCAYMAKIGKDENGKLYEKGCLERDIHPILNVSDKLPTGTILALVTPDGERTLCPDLRACESITAADINADYFAKTRLFHLDGYNLYYPEAFFAALAAAELHQTPISMAICSHEIIASHFDTVMDCLKKRLFKYFFLNEREAFELTGRSDPLEASKQLAPYCEHIVIMMGERGSVAYVDDKFYYKETQPIQPMDTTGAGDMYVGGYLYGCLQDASVEDCMYYGTTTAVEGIKVFGGELPVKHLQQLRQQFTEAYSVTHL